MTSQPRSPAFTMPPPAPTQARALPWPLLVVYAAAVVSGMASVTGSMSAAVARAPALAAGSVIVFVAVGAVGAWLLAKIPFFWPVSLQTRGLAVLWGATAATGYALLANLAIYERLAERPDAPAWSLFAPFTEEPIKDLGIVVVLLLAATRPRTALDGLVVGSFVGLGFEVVENVVQSVNNAIAAAPSGHPGQWASLATDVIHEVLRRSWTGHIVITGFGIAYAMTARRRAMPHRVAVAAGLVLLAFAGHLLWNSHRFGVFYVLGQFGMLAVYLWLIRVGRQQESDLYRPFLGYVGSSVLDAEPDESRSAARKRKRAVARLAGAIGNGDAAKAHQCVERLATSDG
jgi:RsiW-degrading membrane proteinase PrsW (M82 family)